MAPLRDRRGFTMVELLVGMMLSALIIGILFQFLRGQSQFVAVTSARQEVVQNAQGALEIISSDLRSVPPRGVLAATATSISVAIPRAWGIACDAGALGLGLSAVFPNSVPAAAFTVPAGTNVGLLARDPAANAWLPARGAALPSVATAATIANPAAAGSPCAGLLPQVAGVTAVTFTGTNLPAGIRVASPVMLYNLARYDVGDVDGTVWARRSMGMTSLASFTMQPLVGPLPSTNALRFRYFDAAGAAIPIPSGGLAAADLDRIRSIRVVITTQSTNPALNQPDMQQDSAMFSLRNNQ